MTKATGPTMTVRLKDEAGKVVKWTVRYEEAMNFTTGQAPRRVKGWEYTDHEGSKRFVEGTWKDLVPAFRLTAENYGFTTNLS